MMSRSECAGVVQPLVREPRRQRAVAQDSDDLEFLVANVASDGDAECRGDRRSRVTCAEHVILALGPLQKAGQPALLPQRVEAVVASGENLVRVALVTYVPDDLVDRRVEAVVQRDRQLDDAESRADVSARARADIDEACTHLAGQRGQLLAAQLLEIGGRLDSVEKYHVRFEVMSSTRASISPASHERRATTYCAIDARGGVRIRASRSASVASSTSAIAR